MPLMQSLLTFREISFNCNESSLIILNLPVEAHSRTSQASKVGVVWGGPKYASDLF